MVCTCSDFTEQAAPFYRAGQLPSFSPSCPVHDRAALVDPDVGGGEIPVNRVGVPPRSQLCNPWTTTEEVRCCHPELADTPDRVINEAIAFASLWLYRRTGRIFSGDCEYERRPCRSADCGNGKSWSYWDYHYGWGSRGPRDWMRSGACECECQGPCPSTLLKLPGGPIQYVSQILINGEVLDPSAYKILNHRAVLRCDGKKWPIGNDYCRDPKLLWPPRPITVPAKPKPQSGIKQWLTQNGVTFQPKPQTVYVPFKPNCEGDIPAWAQDFLSDCRVAQEASGCESRDIIPEASSAINRWLRERNFMLVRGNCPTCKGAPGAMECDPCVNCSDPIETPIPVASFNPCDRCDGTPRPANNCCQPHVVELPSPTVVPNGTVCGPCPDWVTAFLSGESTTSSTIPAWASGYLQENGFGNMCDVDLNCEVRQEPEKCDPMRFGPTSCYTDAENYGGDIPDDVCPAWSVTYAAGVPVPFDGQIAARMLAAQYALGICGSKDCVLGRGTLSVSRHGTTMRFRDAIEMTEKSLTLIDEVNDFVLSVNPHNLLRSGQVLRPGYRRRGARVTS